MVLLKASNSSVRASRNLLDKFCSLSGLEVNFEKTGLFFSPKVRSNMNQNLKDIFNMRTLNRDSKYVGNPLFFKKKKKNTIF